MSGLTDLHQILGALRPTVRPGGFVVVAVPPGADLPGAQARVAEDEAVTLVLPQADADAAGLPYEEVFGWITLQVHSSLSAVGVTAAVATALARVGLSCNVLAGYYHDHLLVPLSDVDAAVDVLGGLA
jgi:hypothetical protein